MNRLSQAELVNEIAPFLYTHATLVEMNPKEYIIKRPEDFHQNYKYVDNYYQSKHTWNSQTCKTCGCQKKYDEFKMGETNQGDIVVLANCNLCIERHHDLLKNMGWLEKMMARFMLMAFKK